MKQFYILRCKPRLELRILLPLCSKHLLFPFKGFLIQAESSSKMNPQVGVNFSSLCLKFSSQHEFSSILAPLGGPLTLSPLWTEHRFLPATGGFNWILYLSYTCRFHINDSFIGAISSKSIGYASVTLLIIINSVFVGLLIFILFFKFLGFTYITGSLQVLFLSDKMDIINCILK